MVKHVIQTQKKKKKKKEQWRRHELEGSVITLTRLETHL